jgi:hypothetical protein
LVRPALTPARERQCCQLFDSLGRSVDKVAAHYSDSELSVILDFMRRSVEVMHAETMKLTGEEEK